MAALLLMSIKTMTCSDGARRWDPEFFFPILTTTNSLCSPGWLLSLSEGMETLSMLFDQITAKKF